MIWTDKKKERTYKLQNSANFKTPFSAFKDTIAVLVGSETLAAEYVEQSGDLSTYLPANYLDPTRTASMDIGSETQIKQTDNKRQIIKTL